MKMEEVRDALMAAAEEDYYELRDRAERGAGYREEDYFWVRTGDFVVPGVGSVALEREYGGEGQGEEYWYVIKVEMEDGSGTRYFKVDGYYASYDGGCYDNFFEVKPTARMVTFYE